MLWDSLARRLQELLVILSSLDVNKLPKSEHEWKVFDESIELLSSVTKMPTTSLSSRLLLGEASKSNWNCKINPLVIYQERALLIENFAVGIRMPSLLPAGLMRREFLFWLGNASYCYRSSVLSWLAAIRKTGTQMESYGAAA